MEDIVVAEMPVVDRRAAAVPVVNERAAAAARAVVVMTKVGVEAESSDAEAVGTFV